MPTVRSGNQGVVGLVRTFQPGLGAKLFFAEDLFSNACSTSKCPMIFFFLLYNELPVIVDAINQYLF